ncbi:hypothetical protein N431DRAFT_325607 [Stipitochalara longipes BDJ]|nr:hypothetical protein N431DRAFT_325607 [Stipitochalara longipes BDJ]
MAESTLRTTLARDYSSSEYFSEASSASTQGSDRLEDSDQEDVLSDFENWTLEGEFSLLEVGSNQLSAFSLFPSLPLELRTKIWQFSLPGIRLVETRFINMPCHFPMPKLPTPLLHVSQEAREVTLRRYMPLYRLSSPLPLIYINPNVDILFINEHVQQLDAVLSELDIDVLQCLRRIALESMMLFVFPNIAGKILPCLLRLSNLERVTIVLPPTNPEEESGHAVLFELLKAPMTRWPELVQRQDKHLYTRRGLKYCTDKGRLDDPGWLRTRFETIIHAVEERFRANPDRAPPEIDLKGVRRKQRVGNRKGRSLSG